MTMLTAEILNKEQPFLVYAMAKKSLKTSAKITSSKVKSINNKQCEIAVVTCKGDLCEMHNVSYTLPSTNDIAGIRSHALFPDYSLLVTSPFVFFLLSLCIFLGYCTQILTPNELMDIVDNTPWLANVASTIFGSTYTFYTIVLGSWYFMTIAHLFEAIIASYICFTILKLNATTTAAWTFAVSLVGFPFLGQVLEFKNMQHEIASEQKNE